MRVAWTWTGASDAGVSRGEAGQTVVELAVLLPIVIAVALVAFNMVRFLQACAAFDRVAPDCVIAHGVSPAGEQDVASACAQVRAAIEDGLPVSGCEVAVSSGDLGPAPRGKGVSFPVSPLLTTFTCTLSYRPWPSSFSMAGIDLRVPAFLRHERSITVDRFRPGVVV